MKEFCDIYNMEVSNEEFRDLIERAIDRISPFFDLTTKQIQKAKEFDIRRKLDGVYSSHSLMIPGYSYMDNFFFFPKCQPGWRHFKICNPQCSYDDFYKIMGLKSDQVIFHETAHKLHALVNPTIAEGFRTFISGGEKPEHHGDLNELVAEYPNFIIGERDYEGGHNHYLYILERRVFKKYGASFLPDLARMRLEQAIKIGLFGLG